MVGSALSLSPLSYTLKLVSLIGRDLPPGFESKVPVLFLDLHDDLSTPGEDADHESVVMTGSLHGEKPDTMISLPIISSDQQVCDWVEVE